jgi:hypothetical protein
MTQGLIGGLALLALVAQTQTAQRATVSQIRPYSIEIVRAGAGAPKNPQPVIVSREAKPLVVERQNRVERGPCNMPIIVADPTVDPRMILTVEQKNVDPKIRTVEPRACGGVAQPVTTKK